MPEVGVVADATAGLLARGASLIMQPLRRSLKLQPLARKASVSSRILRQASTTSTNMALAETEHTIDLPDGRKLGYAEYGSASGTPLFYFHGFPSSRLEMLGLEHLAAKRRLRVIAPDRPGFGLSSPQPGRRILDWPADVRALAGHLGIERFAVLGGSGGGPYSLACAATFPRETLTAVGVMAGAPPWEAGPGQALPDEVGVQNMELYRRITAHAAASTPLALRLVSDGLVGASRWIASLRMITTRIDAWLEQNKATTATTEDSPNALTTELRRQRLLRSVFEAFAQGSAAMVHEAYLLTRDWGFPFEDVTYDPIRIWHGTKDANAPIALMRYMANRLPNARLKEFDEDHYGFAKHVEEILTELLPDSTEETGVNS
jgi:pimeloyl-ACP methyl ester carboxylesterase